MAPRFSCGRCVTATCRTVMSVFKRLSEQSRRARFNGPKPCLSRSELRQLASIDRSRHALVAYVDGDPQPVAIARLVRDGAAPRSRSRSPTRTSTAASVRRSPRSCLPTRARPASRRSPRSSSSDNPAAVALLRRIAGVFDLRLEGPEITIRAAIA